MTSLLPRLVAPRQQSLSCSIWLQWTEILLAQIASISSKKACSTQYPNNSQYIETSLKAFRLWAGHPHVRRKENLSQSATQPAGLVEPVSQASIWMMYYGFLSTILQRTMAYYPPAEGQPRPQLANEVMRVEARCENVLLGEVKFPAANGSNLQINSFIEQVIYNWEVLCGSDWKDEELGDGGQEAVGRNVLDVSAYIFCIRGCILIYSRFYIELPPRLITPISSYAVYFMSMPLSQSLIQP
jgi:cargo-transport protein YPP1